MADKKSGLTQYGYTKQTVAIADTLQKSGEARARLRRLLDLLDTPIRYSFEDFDRSQAVAGALADFAREGKFNGESIIDAE